jgi:YVTN family beta-propeller protein
VFNGDEVARIDTATNQVVARIPTSPRPCGITVAAGSV